MKNKGYTLVELIVAMTVAAFVSIGLVTLFSLTFKQYKNTQIESQLQIESQTVSEIMKPILMGCSAYKQNTVELKNINQTVEVVEIKTRNQMTKQDGFYYLIINPNEKKCYLQFFVNKVDNLDELIYSANDYLGQYIDNVIIAPDVYDYEEEIKKENSLFNYTIDVTYSFSENNIYYKPSQIITLKSH